MVLASPFDQASEHESASPVAQIGTIGRVPLSAVLGGELDKDEGKSGRKATGTSAYGSPCLASR
jgi:hypothetical protein